MWVGAKAGHSGYDPLLKRKWGIGGSSSEGRTTFSLIWKEIMEKEIWPNQVKMKRSLKKRGGEGCQKMFNHQGENKPRRFGLLFFQSDQVQ